MMDLITEKIYELQDLYNYHVEHGDPRTADFPLMQTYTPTLVLTALYLFIVWLLPQIMKNREPFALTTIMFVYNIGLVALNFHICSEIIISSTALNYSYLCQPVTFTGDVHEQRMAKALWWYYFSKCIEFIDTFIFILRKKNNQVSFLHVYHHATMFPIWWMGVKWVPGGQSFFGAMINSGIHVIMYLYYGLAALGPKMQPYLWWKRYLTNIQLVQFVAGMLNASTGLYIDCDFPRWMGYALIFYGLTIISLFFNFYYHAYLRPKKDAKSGKSKSD